MTPSDRHRTLATLGWQQDSDKIRHLIHGEMCNWYSGEIDGKEWSAWIGTKTGNVYPHGAEDYGFDEFAAIIANGWPVAKVAPAARGFDFGDDE